MHKNVIRVNNGDVRVGQKNSDWGYFVMTNDPQWGWKFEELKW